MTARTMELAGTIFEPRNRFIEGRILSASDGILEKLTIYTWPSGLTSDEKLTYLSYLTAFGRSDSESPSNWASWVYTYIILCFDGMEDLVRRAGGREYHFEKLSVAHIKSVKAIADQTLAFEGSDDNREYAAMLNGIVYPEKFPAMAQTTELFPEILAAGATIPSVYGYCALLIFLAGKKINEKNVITITEKRPQNLIDSYTINEQAAYYLNGDGKMNSQAHKMVGQAWVTYAPARIAIITDVASFAAGSTLPQRVVFTIAKMLENVGMQPAYYIHRFLQAFPLCVDYACIRPSLGVYAASIREVAAADARIQPYYKVINGDLTRAFHRNGLLSLSACAITFEKHTSPSMKNFNLGEGATAAVNMFDMEAMSRGHRTLSSVATITEEEDDE